jgi:hypothetical protein
MKKHTSLNADAQPIETSNPTKLGKAQNLPTQNHQTKQMYVMEYVVPQFLKEGRNEPWQTRKTPQKRLSLDEWVR